MSLWMANWCYNPYKWAYKWTYISPIRLDCSEGSFEPLLVVWCLQERWCARRWQVLWMSRCGFFRSGFRRGFLGGAVNQWYRGLYPSSQVVFLYHPNIMWGEVWKESLRYSLELFFSCSFHSYSQDMTGRLNFCWLYGWFFLSYIFQNCVNFRGILLMEKILHQFIW